LIRCFSTTCIAYIWWYELYLIPTYGGSGVFDVHYSHAVFSWLHTVAHACRRNCRLQPCRMVGVERAYIRSTCLNTLHPTRKLFNPKRDGSVGMLIFLITHSLRTLSSQIDQVIQQIHQIN